jgi:hypothetical protein
VRLRASLSGTLVIAYCSTPSQPRDDFHQVLLRLVSMVELVLLRFVPSAHFGKQLHRAKLVGDFDLATLRVVGLGRSVIGGYFCDGGFQDLHKY